MEKYLPVAAYMFLMSITPGPNNLTMMFLCSRYGVKGSRKFFISSMGSFFVKMFLCGLLNNLLSQYLPKIVDVMKWAGAAYMLYLAYTMARSGWMPEKELKESKDASYSAGVLLQVLNVKSWIAALTTYAVYVTPYPEKNFSIVIVSLVCTAMAIVGSILWGGFGAALSRLIQKYKKPFGIIMGLALAYCAVTAVL